MKQFRTLYVFELKKLLCRRFTILLFATLFLVTLFLNLYSIPLYSVGSEGADAYVSDEDGRHTDWSALVNGIEIRWVDEGGQVVTKTVSPLEYIRLQRQFAMKWSGKPLDDETIQALQAFLEQYDTTTEDGYSIGWSYQNFYWVFQSISATGLNPGSPHTTEAAIQDEILWAQNELQDDLSLTAEERSFWQNHAQLAFPLVMAYTPAYRELLNHARWIHTMLVFFVIIALSESFSLERRTHTRPILQATPKGPHQAVLARVLAGETVAAGSALILYLMSALIQFSLFGTDGWTTPIQQIAGYQWSSLMISAGSGVLLMCGTSMLILMLMGALTMCLSQLSQNSIVPLAVQCAFLLYTLIFDYYPFHRKRMLSQIWQYFPLQRIADTLLYDERLVPAAGRLVTAIPFSMAVYTALILLFLSLCIGHTRLFKRDWR